MSAVEKEANTQAWLAWIKAMNDILKRLEEGIASQGPTDPDPEPDPDDKCPGPQVWDPLLGKCVDPPTDPTPEKPDEGTIKPGGWGASTDVSTWTIVNMRNPPEQFKVVDNLGVNVATNFSTKEKAQQFIDYMKTQPQPGGGGGGEPIDPIPTPDGQLGPYPTTGKFIESTQRGPTTRHYASGKPDDETIEKNCKGIPYKNYQFLVDTTINEIEHDDNISLKYGGVHMGSKGWYDAGVSFEDGQTCLGVEPKHPSTKLCVVKGPKLGNIVGKRIKIAGVFFRDQNYQELWTNLGDGWKLQCKGTAVGGLKPNMDEDHEAQERIDGFVKGSIPTLHMAIVQELSPEVKPQP